MATFALASAVIGLKKLKKAKKANIKKAIDQNQGTDGFFLGLDTPQNRTVFGFRTQFVAIIGRQNSGYQNKPVKTLQLSTERPLSRSGQNLDPAGPDRVLPGSTQSPNIKNWVEQNKSGRLCQTCWKKRISRALLVRVLFNHIGDR